MHWTGRYRRISAFLCLSLLLPTGIVPAAELEWDPDASPYFYQSASNWSDAMGPAGSPPAAGDNVLFGIDGSYGVILGATSVANNMDFENGIIRFVDAGGSMLNNGGLVMIDDSFAGGLGDGASVTLGAATWDSAGDTIVGNTGFGTLVVENGGDFEANKLLIGTQSSGVGEVTVTGMGSTINASLVENTGVYTVGLDGGTGTLNVQAGARLTTSSTGGNDIWLGRGAGSTGTLNIEGSGSFAETEDLIVGYGGQGHVNISGGGVITQTDGTSSPDMLVAFDSPTSQGTVSIQGDGSAWNFRRGDIGYSGMGTASVLTGGLLNATGDLVLGTEDTAVGSLTVAGVGTTMTPSRLNAGGVLRVGDVGKGTLIVEDGAVADVGASLVIGDDAANTQLSLVRVSGEGSVLNVGDLINPGNSTSGGGSGSLEVLSGAIVNNARGRVGSNTGSTVGFATVDGRGSQWNMSGDFFVGNLGTGTASVSDGGLITTGGQIVVGSRSTSDGTLTVTGVNDNGTPDTADDIRSIVDMPNVSGANLYVGGWTNQTGAVGELNVLDGGLIDSQLDTFVGGVPGSDGRVVVSGVNANGMRSIADFNDNLPDTTANDETFIGSSAGEGRVEVLDGGFITSERVTVNGSPADATRFGMAQPFAETVLISGVNDNGTPGDTSDDLPSTWESFDGFQVGDTLKSSLRIENGGRVVSDDVSIRSSVGKGSAADGSSVVIDGTGSNWTHTGDFSVALSAGDVANPVTLDIQNGGSMDVNRILIADGTGSRGIATVTGDNSRLDATDIFVGDQSVGFLNVTGGAVAEAQRNIEIGAFSTGNGTVVVSGGGSQLIARQNIALGDSSSSSTAFGQLTVESGGLVQSDNEAQIGSKSLGNATVNVNGEGTWNANSMYVGGRSDAAAGNGVLNINEGGSVNVTTDFKIWGDGAVTLDGGSSGQLSVSTFTRAAGSTFNFSSGRLELRGNQVLDSAALADIFNNNATLDADMVLAVGGIASLDAPLRLNGGTLTVGSIDDVTQLDFDAGTLRFTTQDLVIEDDGVFGSALVLNSAQNLVIDQVTVNNGLINSTGNTLHFQGGLTNNADLALARATVNGEVTTPAGSTVTVIGQVDFMDSVSGAGNFYGPGTANFAGGYSPGDSPAVVAFEGHLAFSDSNTLFVEIGGDNNSNGAQYDQLIVEGTALLDGSLDVSLIDLGSGIYAPQQGDSFAILSAAGGFGGTFSSLNLPALSGGLDWQLNPGGNTLFLNVISSVISGDFNGDGDLDGDDADLLVSVVAAMTNEPTFDLNGDGSVNQVDLQDWLAAAGAANLASGNPYLVGDANLDGTVDGQDFVAWNSAKFSATAAWTAGDFNADGVVDGQDFVSWNANKFSSADGLGKMVPVPEPGGMTVCLLIGIVACWRRRN